MAKNDATPAVLGTRHPAVTTVNQENTMDAPGKNAQSKAVADATTLNKPQPTPALKAKAAAKPRPPRAR